MDMLADVALIDVDTMDAPPPAVDAIDAMDDVDAPAAAVDAMDVMDAVDAPAAAAAAVVPADALPGDIVVAGVGEGVAIEEEGVVAAALQLAPEPIVSMLEHVIPGPQTLTQLESDTAKQLMLAVGAIIAAVVHCTVHVLPAATVDVPEQAQFAPAGTLHIAVEPHPHDA